MTPSLPYPKLNTVDTGGIRLITDDALFQACGVRMGFTERAGGTSDGPYRSLNLATHVDDDLHAVEQNRRRLLRAVDAPDALLIVPNQVHGTNVVHLESNDPETVRQRACQAAAGADGVVVTCENAAALLCFADCMPVVIVSPGGAFAVVHAGWRGVYDRIVPKALSLLGDCSAASAESCNVYLGPCIHAECFEVDEDLAQRFADAFGADCVPDPRHVDLVRAMRTSLRQSGVDMLRVADSDACTVCCNDRFFSYRAQKGVCGRHGAIAVRVSG